MALIGNKIGQDQNLFKKRSANEQTFRAVGVMWACLESQNELNYEFPSQTLLAVEAPRYVQLGPISSALSSPVNIPTPSGEGARLLSRTVAGILASSRLSFGRT